MGELGKVTYDEPRTESERAGFFETREYDTARGERAPYVMHRCPACRGVDPHLGGSGHKEGCWLAVAVAMYGEQEHLRCTRGS